MKRSLALSIGLALTAAYGQAQAGNLVDLSVTDLDTGKELRVYRDGGKFYGPTVNSLGKILHLKSPKGTAADAYAYSKRFCARYERLKNAQKEIPGN